MTQLNILSNDIGIEHAEALIQILGAEDNNLVTLCGLSGDETSIDFSSRCLTDSCMVLIANEIKNNKQLMTLDLSYNYLGRGGVPRVQGKTGDTVAVAGARVTDRALV